MKDQKHTPEPWEANEHESISGDNYITIKRGSWDIAHSKYSANDWEVERANAARIVACINALEGWADPSAAGELLEATKNLAMLAVLKYGNLDPEANEIFTQYRAVLARIEGRE